MISAPDLADLGGLKTHVSKKFNKTAKSDV